MILFADYRRKWQEVQRTFLRNGRNVSVLFAVDKIVDKTATVPSFALLVCLNSVLEYNKTKDDRNVPTGHLGVLMVGAIVSNSLLPLTILRL